MPFLFLKRYIMIYRIDIQHFLTHAIDYFTQEEISHFQYAVISAIVKSYSSVLNVSKVDSLYPLPEILIDYEDHKDKSIMEKMYMDFLSPKKENDAGMTKRHMANIFYRTFINTLNNHVDIMIVCDRSENEYIDVICKVLKKDYSLEVIDLNKLFSEGRIGPIYIDRKEIWDKCVDIRRAAGKDMNDAIESSKDGRKFLLSKMTKKQKIKKIEELGITLTNYNKKELDSILMDIWVLDEDN